jgi:hypothetical protein
MQQATLERLVCGLSAFRSHLSASCSLQSLVVEARSAMITRHLKPAEAEPGIKEHPKPKKSEQTLDETCELYDILPVQQGRARQSRQMSASRQKTKMSSQQALFVSVEFYV